MPQELEDQMVLVGSDLPVTFRLSSNVSVLMGSSNGVQRRFLQVVAGIGTVVVKIQLR